MGENEEATLRTLSSHRKLIDSLIEQHRGRFVNSADDSVLAEFASVVNAVQCAVEIQTTLKIENANLPVQSRMEFRIGVNVAARIFLTCGKIEEGGAGLSPKRSASLSCGRESVGPQGTPGRGRS